MKLIKILIILIFLAPLLFLFMRFISYQDVLSTSQQQIIDLFGHPSQFVLTYLPNQSDSHSYSRYELWYYPDINQQFTFLAGNLIDNQDYSLPVNLPSLDYFPWDFDLHTDLSTLFQYFGKDNLTLIDLPAFNQDGLQTYTNGQYLFVIEEDFLTYAQTLFPDSDSLEQNLISSPSPSPDSSNIDKLKTYLNSDIGFSINHPDSWYLEYGVLSSYNPNYLQTGDILPDEIIKCDFITYSPEQFDLSQLNPIQKQPIQISKAQVLTEETSYDDQDSLGYGDNVVFLFEDDQHQPIALVCFAYSQTLESQLINTLKTFTFLN